MTSSTANGKLTSPMQQASDRPAKRIPALSNELTSRIIDHLANDPQSLKNLALCCRSFRPRARYNLFHSVSLHLKNSQKFHRLLEASPEVGHYVKELHVTVSVFEQKKNWVDRLLPCVAPKMPNVVALHMNGKGVYRAAPLRALQSVKTIRVHGCEIESINELCTILGSFPRLEAMITDEMFVYRSKEIVVKSTVRPTNFRTLVFNSCRVDPAMLVDWLTQESLVDNLEYLATCPIQQVGLPPLAKLTRAAGASLQHFKIALVGLVAQGGFVELLERNGMLTFNPNLRVLELGSPAAYSALYGADDLSFAWFPTILSQVNSPVIETVGFYLWEGDLEGMSSAAWDNVVYVLSSEQFKSLKKLVFHVWGNPTKAGSIVGIVKERFASFDERGLLHIDDVPDPAC